MFDISYEQVTFKISLISGIRVKKTILSLGLLMAVSANAQQEFIRGKLLDAVTEEPVPFATIRVKGKYKGVISNEDGGFRIPQIFKQYGDTLEISSMGYQETEWRITNLSPEHINILRLNPGVFELNEAIVRAKEKKGLSAKQIVRRAIRNIPKNYPLDSFSEIGYYRDYQRDEEEYVNLNEAILEVFDQGFDTSDSATTKVRLYDYTLNSDFKQDTTSSISYDYENYQKTIDDAYLSDYGGNEFTILRVHDAIRNYDVNSYSFINRLDRNLLKHHKFSKHIDAYWNGERLYTIKFKRTSPKYTAKGILYIGKEDFGIVKLEYEVYNENRFDIYKEKQNSGKERQLIFEIDTEYRRAYDKLYLNYISFHNSFRVLLPPLFYIMDIKIHLREQVFVIYFNNDVDKATARYLKNYDFRYGDKSLKFKEVRVLGDRIYLFPQLYEEDRKKFFSDVWRTLNAGNQEKTLKELSEILTAKVEGVLDVDGNLVNEIRYKNYNQFREFFVQELKPQITVPDDTLFMNKNKPIFDNQLIIQPDNFKEYWMNTPLKTVIE